MGDQVISYETAKLLHKFENKIPIGLGYKYGSGQYYNTKGVLNGDVTDYIKAVIKNRGNETKVKNPNIAAPTQTYVVKLLREKYNIDVVIVPERYSNGINYLSQGQKWDLTSNASSDNCIVGGTFWFNDNGEYPTYEEALEVAIYESIKNLM